MQYRLALILVTSILFLGSSGIGQHPGSKATDVARLDQHASLHTPVPVDSGGGPITIRLVENDGQVWSLEVERDTSWGQYDIPLAAFGSGSEFLNTPVAKFVVVPIGGGGLIGGPLTEVAEWIDNIILADSLIDNFDDEDYSDWFLNIALNGSYLGKFADIQTPNGSPRCIRLIHGNTMGQTFSGWIEKRFVGLNLSPDDTLRFWLRGKSYLITDVRDVPAGIPSAVQLLQNYPNPFNPSTTIRYQLPERTRVTLRIHDVLGREIAPLVDGVEEPGYKSVTWSASGVASGVYFCRLQAGSFVDVKKLVLVR